MQSKALFELIDTIDTLEQRVWGADSPPPRTTLVLGQMQRVLLQAGRLLGKAQAVQRGDAELRIDLRDTVRRIIESVAGDGPRAPSLSTRHAALIQFAEDLFRYVESSCDLDSAAYAVVQYLKIGMARTLILDPRALERRDHPVRLFCEYLISSLKGYDRRSGSRADALMGRVAGVVKSVVETPLAAEAAYEAAYEAARRELIALIDTFDQDSSMFARNLIAKEKGEASRCDARLTVNRAILEAVSGKRLPLVLLQFLQQIWSKYLYITHLRQGMDSREWREGIDDIGVLARSLDIRDRDGLFRFYGTHLSKTLDRLRAGADSIYGDAALAERFFEVMDQICVETLAGRDQEIEDLTDLTTTSEDGLQDGPEALVVNAANRKLVESLRVGRWYHFTEKGMALRCQLIERNQKHRYCLFANLSGIKVARQEYAQAARAVESGLLQPIDTAPVLDRAMAYAGERLVEKIAQLENQALEAERLRAEAHERQRQEESALRLQQLQQARLREQARVLEEKRRRAQEQAKRQAEAQERSARLARERALHQVLADVERMQSGGRVDLIDGDRRKVTCKLGLKLKSSGKMIFVDHLGRKMCELLPEDLATRIIDGSAGILDYGVAFDDTLRDLIVERSEKIHVDDP